MLQRHLLARCFQFSIVQTRRTIERRTMPRKSAKAGSEKGKAKTLRGRRPRSASSSSEDGRSPAREPSVAQESPSHPLRPRSRSPLEDLAEQDDRRSRSSSRKTHAVRLQLHMKSYHEMNPSELACWLPLSTKARTTFLSKSSTWDFCST